jgi:glycolate oxidase FAD binding subunit
VLTFGGQVMKNVAGYDVSRLLAGSLGTLGVLLEVSLKVLPVAPSEATLWFSGLSQQSALDLLNRWGGQPLPLNASCWVHDSTEQPPRDALFVRLRGAVAAVEAACPRMLSDALALGAQVQRMDGPQAGADWNACREQTLTFFKEAPVALQALRADLCLWRLSLPQTTPALALPADVSSPLIEWHGGLRWVWAPANAAALLLQHYVDNFRRLPWRAAPGRIADCGPPSRPAASVPDVTGAAGGARYDQRALTEHAA